MVSFLQPFRDIERIIAGYTALVRERLSTGWSGYLMTFMFNPLRGSTLEKNDQMKGEIEGFHSSLVTRLIRRPRSHGAHPPILFTAPDWPVLKKAKKTITEVTVNDGLHHHGILLVPPPDRRHRLKVPVDQHIRVLQNYYTRDEQLQTVDARQFPELDVGNVTDYALKGIKTGRLSYDDAMLVLPACNPCARPYVKKGGGDGSSN